MSMRYFPLRLLLTLAGLAGLAGLSGCAGDGSQIPDTTGPLICAQVEPRLSCIQQFVFTPTCAVSGCHDIGSQSAGLVLEEGLSHSNLVSVASSEVSSLFRAEPNNPDDSYIVIKLEGTDPRIMQAQMPLLGSVTSADIQAIRDWIANGAPDD